MVNRHRLCDTIMVPTKWFTRRAEKGFSKKILLLCALSESNSSAINKLYTRNKNGFLYRVSCRWYSRARARTIIIIIIMVRKKSICSNLLSLAQYFQVNRTQFDNIIIVGCIFVFFMYDNSRELPFKTISLATYIMYNTTEH